MLLLSRAGPGRPAPEGGDDHGRMGQIRAWRTRFDRPPVPGDAGVVRGGFHFRVLVQGVSLPQEEPTTIGWSRSELGGVSHALPRREAGARGLRFRVLVQGVPLPQEGSPPIRGSTSDLGFFLGLAAPCLQRRGVGAGGPGRRGVRPRPPGFTPSQPRDEGLGYASPPEGAHAHPRSLAARPGGC